MHPFPGPQLAGVMATLASLASVTLHSPAEWIAPERFALYYSGPPCAQTTIDRTYSQFQVNLGKETQFVQGRLRAGAGREAVLLDDTGREIRLVTNASRAEWLLTYPMIERPVGVWARAVVESDCTVDPGTLYVESLFPLDLLAGPIDPAMDLLHAPGDAGLKDALSRYGKALRREAGSGSRGGAAARLEKELFSAEASSAPRPWRARLAGHGEPGDLLDSVDIVLSGSDGSTGMFGHIAVGSGGQVYNVYPKGSDRGAPGPLPLGDYLFNVQRGQALRRPTWILRLEGLPKEAMAAVRNEIESRVEEIAQGEILYHPTANNCTTVSLAALERIGFTTPAARYFTRRFPRPAFARILEQLPHLLASGRLKADGAELIFIPQVPVRISEGGAPNRPLRDRSRIMTQQAAARMR